MRFCDFFADYKNRIKEVKMHAVLPMWCMCILIFIEAGLCAASLSAFRAYWGRNNLGSLIFVVFPVLIVVIFAKCLSQEKEKRLEDAQKYSSERINVLKASLDGWGFSADDEKTIILLIEAAKNEKLRNLPMDSATRKAWAGLAVSFFGGSIALCFQVGGSPVEALWGIIVWTSGVLLVLFSFSLMQPVRELVYRFFFYDGRIYDGLIYDLEQLRLSLKCSLKGCTDGP